MKPHRTILTLVCLAGILAVAAAVANTVAAAPPLGVSAKARCVNVVDGDTLDIEITIPMRIRLLDCWAPESRTTNAAEKKLGLAAKANLQKLVVGTDGTVFIPTQDAQSVMDLLTLNRVLGKYWAGDNLTDVSHDQVKAGFASTAKGKPLGE